MFFLLGLLMAGCDGSIDSNSDRSSGVASPTTMKGFISQQSLADTYAFESSNKSQGDSGVAREVVSFSVDGLNQYALILWPQGSPPSSGWPLLMFNHGFHPDPPNYGRIDGVSARPGQYYWASAQAYAEHGYVVVVADYRGHNDSDGQVFSVGRQLVNWFSNKMHGVYKPAYWYTRDVIAAYFAAVKLPNINTNKVYMVGHSMGGGITQRSILALGDRIKAASIWSTSAGHMALEPYWQDLQVPLLIQHGEEDQINSSDDSKSLASMLDYWHKPHRLLIVETGYHLFEDNDFEQALQQDLQWFAQFP